MRSWLAGLRRLIIPWGAGPNQPAIVIGADIPPEIIARYPGADVIGVIIMRLSAANYVWLALLVELGVVPVLAVGTTTGGLVTEAYTISQIFGSNAAFRIGEGDPIDVFMANDPAAAAFEWAGESIVQVGTWTPVLTQATTNPTAGFDDTVGRYRRQGDLCFFWIRTTILDATKAGTGRYIWTVPFDLQQDSQLAIASAIDTSAGLRIPCAADLDSSGAGSLDLRQPSGAQVTQASPFAVANGDIYVAQGTYMVA